MREMEANYMSTLRSAGRGVQEAFLISEENKHVRIPLVTLVASSPLVKTAAGGQCLCLEVGISLPGFSHHTLELLADFVSGKDVRATNADINHLTDLCTVLGINCSILALPVVHEGDAQNEMNHEFIPDTLTDSDMGEADSDVLEPSEPSNVIDAHSGIAVGSEILDSVTEITFKIKNLDGRKEASVTKNVTEKGTGSYVCEICSRVLKCEKTLRYHQQIHTGEKPHRCTVCDKHFRLKAGLKLHMLVHNGVRPLSCPVCQRPFREKGHLNKHMRTHDRLRPFMCEVCGRTFTVASSLRRHMLIDCGKKPHVCNVCGMGFKVKSMLTRHKGVHNKKVHSCNVCHRSFRGKRILNAHIRKCKSTKPADVKQQDV